MNWRLVAIAGLAVMAASVARADLNLVISNNAVLWDGIGPSPSVTLGVINPLPTELGLFAGWQTTLNLVPQPGAVGTLTFNSPTSSFNSPPPANYVFTGAQAGPVFVFNNGAQLVAGGPDPTVVGIVVPATGSNLLMMDFVLSPGGSGTWNLVAAPGAGFTEWSRVVAPQTTAPDAFANVPFTGPSLILGTISTSVIPEPSAFVLAAVVSLGGVCVARWRKAKLPERVS